MDEVIFFLYINEKLSCCYNIRCEGSEWLWGREGGWQNESTWVLFGS